jgi:hypothetical protein
MLRSDLPTIAVRAMVAWATFRDEHKRHPSQHELIDRVAYLFTVTPGRASQYIAKARHHWIIDNDNELTPVGEEWLSTAGILEQP